MRAQHLHRALAGSRRSFRLWIVARSMFLVLVQVSVPGTSWHSAREFPTSTNTTNVTRVLVLEAAVPRLEPKLEKPIEEPQGSTPRPPPREARRVFAYGCQMPPSMHAMNAVLRFQHTAAITAGAASVCFAKLAPRVRFLRTVSSCRRSRRRQALARAKKIPAEIVRSTKT